MYTKQPMGDQLATKTPIEYNDTSSKKHVLKPLHLPLDTLPQKQMTSTLTRLWESCTMTDRPDTKSILYILNCTQRCAWERANQRFQCLWSLLRLPVTLLKCHLAYRSCFFDPRITFVSRMCFHPCPTQNLQLKSGDVNTASRKAPGIWLTTLSHHVVTPFVRNKVDEPYY